MSFVITSPATLAAAATNLASIGSAISSANFAAAAPTRAVLAACADEVSTAVGAVFGAQARTYQSVGAQMAAFHDQFVQALTAGAGAYAGAEAANVQQIALNAINAPTQTLLGRPLIGDGPNGAAPGAAGGPGGLL